MPLSDAYLANTAQYTVIRILTVDRDALIVEGVLRDGGKIKIGIFDPGTAFRWPQVDELWTVKRNGYDWELTGRVRSQGETNLNDLGPGELLLDAETVVNSQGKAFVVQGQASNKVQVLDTLPSVAAVGDIAYLASSNKLFTFNGTSWVQSLDSTSVITNTQIADIAAGKITGSLTSNQIADLAASKVTGTISDTQIAALAASKINGTLSDAQLAAISAAKVSGQLTNAQIAGMDASKVIGKLIAGQINVATLSAISGDVGTLTAGVIQGPTIRTASSGGRIEIDTSGIHAYSGSPAALSLDLTPDYGIRLFSHLELSTYGSNQISGYEAITFVDPRETTREVARLESAIYRYPVDFPVTYITDQVVRLSAPSILTGTNVPNSKTVYISTQSEDEANAGGQAQFAELVVTENGGSGGVSKVIAVAKAGTTTKQAIILDQSGASDFLFKNGSNLTTRLSMPGIYLTGNIVLDTNSYKLGARAGTNNFGGDTWEFTTGATSGAANGDSDPAYVRGAAFLSGSDASLKTNVQPVSTLDRIENIGVYSYNWKDKQSARTIGVLGQEIESHFPEAASRDERDLLSVDYGQIAAIALAAVKELKAEVDSLRLRLK